MKHENNIREAAKLPLSFMGFIFYEGSKRSVEKNFVMPALPSSIKKVGVFVNESIKNISSAIEKYKLDLVQLHGDEPAAFCKEMNEKVKVIKAFGIDEKFDLEILKDYENCCEYFLFDTRTSQHGGSGKKFNWEILERYQLEKPFFLSGGIGPGDADEIKKIKQRVPQFFAVDVNSKFETEPGIKDISKLKQFMHDLQSE